MLNLVVSKVIGRL